MLVLKCWFCRHRWLFCARIVVYQDCWRWGFSCLGGLLDEKKIEARTPHVPSSTPQHRKMSTLSEAGHTRAKAAATTISSGTVGEDAGASNRRSACDRCRGHKLRCLREGNDPQRCDRCVRANAKCLTTPSLRMGRPPRITTSHDDAGGRKRRRAQSIHQSHDRDFSSNLLASTPVSNADEPAPKPLLVDGNQVDQPSASSTNELELSWMNPQWDWQAQYLATDTMNEALQYPTTGSFDANVIEETTEKRANIKNVSALLKPCIVTT